MKDKEFSNTLGTILWNYWDKCSGYIFNDFPLILASNGNM